MNSVKRILPLLIILTATSGCTRIKVEGLTPTYPPLQPQTKIPTISSLQPTFVWQPSNEPDTTYDLVIYEGLQPKSHPRAQLAHLPHRGRRVYYRENLSDASHQIEIPLHPDSLYYWSVRVRRNHRTYEWSTYNWADTMNATGTYSNSWFAFLTPTNKS